MLHPIFTTVLGHPELIARHASNYVSLVKEEAAAVGRGILTRAVAGVVAFVFALTALGLIGVAVMLGVLHGEFNWVLIVVPGIALLVAAVAGYITVRPAAFNGFGDVRDQFEADLQALHLAKETRHGK